MTKPVKINLCLLFNENNDYVAMTIDISVIVRFLHHLTWSPRFSYSNVEPKTKSIQNVLENDLSGSVGYLYLNVSSIAKLRQGGPSWP